MVFEQRHAEAIFRKHFGDVQVATVTRFPTGLCHFVFDLMTHDGKEYVIRISANDTLDYFEGHLYWYRYLKNLGIPIPDILVSSREVDCSYTILSRLPGTDLGQVYEELGDSEKKNIAEDIAQIQDKVRRLQPASRFGYARSYEGINSTQQNNWSDIIDSEILRSQKRISAIGIVDLKYVNVLRESVSHFDSYFRSVSPCPFLDDTTTKNVIVHKGRLSGIVDTDEICFGDCLQPIGLTKMALHSIEKDTDYVEYWLDAIKASKQQRRVVNLYTLMFCLTFMSEQGQTFNKEIPVDISKMNLYYSIFRSLMPV